MPFDVLSDLALAGLCAAAMISWMALDLATRGSIRH